MASSPIQQHSQGATTPLLSLLEQREDSAGAELASGELERILDALVLLRTFDERCVAFQRQGRIGTYALHWGHEAVQVGAALAAGPEDWLFPSYRESAIGLLRGMPIETVLCWWRGRPEGWWDPAERRVASICVPIATHIPHAAGLAWGLKLRSLPGCAIAFFGDGATSEGAFHEGVNFAAVNEVPLVLLCNNNGLALSTPLVRQTRAATLADKALGYGIPAMRVDGTDVLAVHAATRTALAHAREGRGPTLIEAVSYRARAHATADAPELYVDAARAEAADRDECVGRFVAYARERGLAVDELLASTRHAVERRIADAMQAVEALPTPEPSELFDRVYTEPPVALLRAREALMNSLPC